MLFGGADFFVLPSHREGDSVAIKEVLAARLPALISNRCHFPDVQRGGAGLVTADMIEALTPALSELSSMTEAQSSARSAAAKKLAGDFDFSRLVARAWSTSTGRCSRAVRRARAGSRRRQPSAPLRNRWRGSSPASPAPSSPQHR